MPKNLTIALAGNPNAGKTTLFNALTGARQHVGNYPGITVEKREGVICTLDTEVHVMDLPGTYSLTAYSQEELVARNYLAEERPEVVVDVLDATCLERNLYLAVQFLEMGIPLVLALNMVDSLPGKGISIDSGRLSSLMRLPVVETVGRRGIGKEKLLEAVVNQAAERQGRWEPLRLSYGPDLDPVLDQMAADIEKADFLSDKYAPRWIALKYLEEDEEIFQLCAENPALHAGLDKAASRVSEHCQKTLNMHPEAIIADYRYGYIASILKQGVISTTTDIRDRVDFSDKLDQVLTHRVFGPSIMVFILYALFHFTFAVGEIPMGWVESFFAWLSGTTASLLPDGLLRSLVVDGIIGGVGGVLGFVPLILVMFLGITFLEDSGYMARMAYMLDRVFRIFGLHGSSVVPFIVSGGIPGGCAVPGVLAARTLRSPKEKLATLLTAPYMACGAKVPVFILLTAAFFPNSAALVMFLLTLSAWGIALCVAKILRSTVIRGKSTPFVMELPPYRMPTLLGVMLHTWERGWQYIKKAGTVILAISILIWALMTFPRLPHDQVEHFETERQELLVLQENTTTDAARAALADRLTALDNREVRDGLLHSVAGRLGTGLETISGLAGFDWRTNIALLGGVAAKEVIVSTLGTVYSLGEVAAEDSGSFSRRLAADPAWNPIRALSLMVFVLTYAPCFVTVVAIAREASWKWAAFSVVFNTMVGFVLAVAVYQIGNLIR
jgi:ferrous iron transport protein B